MGRCKDRGGAKPAASGDLRSRFPVGPAAAVASAPEFVALRRRAYGQGLMVIDTRAADFRRQGFALVVLDWYRRQMEGS